MPPGCHGCDFNKGRTSPIGADTRKSRHSGKKIFFNGGSLGGWGGKGGERGEKGVLGGVGPDFLHFNHFFSLEGLLLTFR